MVDGGTSCEGYASDITRTTVFGKPTQRQIDVWNKEKEAQSAAFAAMKLGAPCESVDAAARAVIVAAGFGPALQGAGPAPSHGTRHRPRRPRVDKLREGQQDAAGRRACASATSR